MKTIKKSESKTNLKNKKNSLQKIFPSFKDNFENNTNKKLFNSVRKYKI